MMNSKKPRKLWNRMSNDIEENMGSGVKVNYETHTNTT